jgi:hypothetical protein
MTPANTAMSPQDVAREIARVCDHDFDKELAPLAERLRHADSTTAFAALFPFAAHSQDHGPAAPAAWLLRRVNPKCPITCRDAIHEMLTDWDVSIEELPFYLAEQFGIFEALAAVTELESMLAVQSQIATLGAIRYWLGCYQEMVNSRGRHSAQQIGTHEPPLPGANSDAPVLQTLDLLPDPGPGGAR